MLQNLTTKQLKRLYRLRREKQLDYRDCYNNWYKVNSPMWNLSVKRYAILQKQIARINRELAKRRV